MKIAITHAYSWPDTRRGAERIVVETSQALARRGHDVTVITSEGPPGRTHEDGVTTIRLRRLTPKASRHERTFGYRVVPHLLRGRFDAVHSMLAWDAYCATKWRSLGGYRVIFDEMGIPSAAYWDQQRDGRLRRYLAKHVDVYGCMSQHALDVLLEDMGRRGDLIPGGVKTNEFRVDDPREPVPTVLFSGALAEPRKGLNLLLQAAALLLPEIPDMKIWLSGPGDPEPILQAAPPEARRIVELLPLGRPEEQCHRYRRAWVTSLPSTSDSFGMVLIESLAAGTPIAVLNDAAPPEFVTPETGAVAAPGDPQSLAKALKTAIDLARRPETSEHCRDFAMKFDWDASIAPLLERLYAAPVNDGA